MRIFRSMLMVLVVTGSGWAQTEAHSEFEVASIKPAAPGAGGLFMIGTTPGGRINMTNVTLKQLIVTAYRIQPFQISGGPAWLDSIHYDISAKAEDKPKQGELQLMLQALLGERFQLKFQRETKELPIYALVVARKDGRPGPALVESKEGACTQADLNKPPPPPEPGQAPVLNCGQMMMSPRAFRMVSAPVGNMIPMLSRLLGRTIVDKTELTAKYDITLEWTPDESIAIQVPADAPKSSPSDSNGPSIFTAIQEQLGLKLESQRGPVEIFVIERAEKPSEN